MNPPSLFILLAESGATVVAYILLIAGPLLALFFYLCRKAKRTRGLMTATETSPIGQLTEGPAEVRGRTAISEEPLISPWRQQPCGVQVVEWGGLVAP